MLFIEQNVQMVKGWKRIVIAEREYIYNILVIIAHVLRNLSHYMFTYYIYIFVIHYIMFCMFYVR